MSFYRRLAISSLYCALALLVPSAYAELLEPKVYTTKYPLKDKRMLITDDEIATMRSNVERFKTAKGIASKIISRADNWVAWDDADLRALVPTGDVTRAFNVGTAGCPQCGKKIYDEGGTYPWKLDPKKPFKVTCPVDGSTYPSNDYKAFYDSGFEDRSLLTGDYADDGRGWVDENGERYWFVAYANHWILRNHVIPAAHYLGRAYILTGDKKYAQKAAVLLDRFAEVYPNMDYHPQSRYGAKQAANGSRYEGKIVNWIWATGNLTMLAEAYDYVWDGIDDHSVPGKSSEEVRANIEANLLEEGIRSYFNGKVRGNFGMHQKALVYAGLARQYGEQDTWFDGLLNNAGNNYRMTGLNYALYNLVYRDGTPYETSPGYNFSWVVNITIVAETLKRAGYDVYALPKMRRLYDSVLDIVNINQYTPSLGDSGGIYGGMVGRNPFVYQSAWRAYKDPRFLAHLQSFGVVGEKSFSNFESLIHPPIEAKKIKTTTAKSRLMDGYGMAILNNPSDTVSLALYYGYKGGHGHMDRLSFELFANNKVMMPDTGYPDFMNAYVPGIFTWSKNTIAHNTLTVDASMQANNHPGQVHQFVDKGIARALDIDAAKTYDSSTEYRRRMMMIDFDTEQSYVIDCFTAKGGTQHDYSLHGPTGTFDIIGGTWSDPAKGTLAGEDVPLGYIYDNPTLAKEGFTGSYTNYKGSGFQHLTQVQRLQKGTFIGEWTHERDPKAKLRIHYPDPASDNVLANAQVSPVKFKELLKYHIAREQGENLDSTFVSVIEPFTDKPKIRDVKIHQPTKGKGRILEISWINIDGKLVRDVVALNTGAPSDQEAFWYHPLALGAASTFNLLRYVDNEVSDIWFSGNGGIGIKDIGKGIKLDMDHPEPGIGGKVISLKPETGLAIIQGDFSEVNLDALTGRTAFFTNSLRRTAHTIASAQKSKEGLVLTLEDDIKIGHIMLYHNDKKEMVTGTGMAFAPVYDGRYISDNTFKHIAPIKGIHGGEIKLLDHEKHQSLFSPNQDIWVLDIGPGDTLDISGITHIDPHEH